MLSLEERREEITYKPRIRKIVQKAFLENRISMADMMDFNNSRRTKATI